MARRLRCLIGAHRWRVVQKDPPYRQCQDCDATQDIVVPVFGAGEGADVAKTSRGARISGTSRRRRQA
jgi:hypothetical protein